MKRGTSKYISAKFYMWFFCLETKERKVQDFESEC